MTPWGDILTVGAGLIDSLFTSDEERAEAKLRLATLQEAGKLKQMEMAMSTIVAEANSEHWIVAAWRPLTMLTFTAIIANNYIVYPYLSLFWTEAPVLELPPDLWDLLKIGLGGYVVGRSTEKAVKAYKG